VNDLGLAPLEVIKWATFNGAGMMGRSDIGHIEAGKLADIVVVDGDPIADISVLEDRSKILMVMQGGNVITSSLPTPVPSARAPLAAVSQLERTIAVSYGGLSSR